VGFNLVGKPFDVLYRDRPLGAGDARTPEQFLSIKGLSPAIAFDHHYRRGMDALVSGEALLADLTFAPSSYAVAGLARVHDS